jgi:hypothetical protein
MVLMGHLAPGKRKIKMIRMLQGSISSPEDNAKIKIPVTAPGF